MDIIDRLSKQVENLVAEIDTLAKTKHKHSYSFSHTHDDGVDGEVDASDPSMDDADAENTDDGEEEDNTDMGKASINAVLRENDTDNRPGDLKHSDHAQSRHKFEALTDKIKNDKGCPRSEAMAYARQQFPDVYADYQRHTNGNDSTAKRAPDLVELEMRKGVTREVASQRVAQLWGYRAFDQSPITKRTARAEEAEYDLITKANEVWEDSDLSRCEALRKARLDNPRLHRVLTRG
jgi:hypothetical protein